MAENAEQLYAERYDRYSTAMRNGTPDRVPIRPFVAEFAAKYAGYTCQEVTHDPEKAYEAVLKCTGDFDWDAAVANMVYVWTGLTQAIGLTYYGVPGIDVPADTGFQYREPPEDKAFMRPDEYDALIADPTGFLLNTWLPRVAADVVAPGEANTLRNNLSFLKGGMAMLQYFTSLGGQVQAMRERTGTPSAIAGILKAPMDILADKLRGYYGLCMDVLERPEKVKAACEALAPHLLHVALGSSAPDKSVPVAIWMHRSCVPFFSHEHVETIHWPTLKPIIEGLWNAGLQTLFYAEGKWAPHLDLFLELPAGSIIYHCDQDDVFEVHRKVGHRFAVSGGVPNFLLGYRPAEEVTSFCRKIIDEVAPGGGYIADASAIVQNDAKVENVRAMTDAFRKYGEYGSSAEPAPKPADGGARASAPPRGLKDVTPRPGVCIPWAEKLAELPEITGDADLVRRVWEDIDSLAYVYIWHCLVSF